MRVNQLLDLRADPVPIAGVRMLLAFALAVCAIEAAATLHGIAAGKLRFPWLDVIPAPTALAVQAYLIIGLLAAVFLLVGVLTAAAAAVGSATLAVALVWDQQTYSSHHLLVTLLLAYLAFADSGQRLSLSSFLRGAADAVPWWPQLLMMTQVSVLYFFAAVSKINPLFLSGEPLQGWMWADLPLVAFQVLAVATIATELFLAVGLWIPRIRILAVVAGVGLHAGIVIGLSDQTLVLTAFAAASMSTYWLFLTRPPLLGPRAAVTVAKGDPADDPATTGDRF